ncbi:hypothetical protein llap_7366 [Limosa lapponica baueri]|uniref:Uncharacterized protein n=1 Tax=Limosa lapponica baueri TaxID=1758121 RepID=A0A2I0U8N3_LIMLA|nr:hypothetical protein llap_7366 [Limosa lapponica baueri]
MGASWRPGVPDGKQWGNAYTESPRFLICPLFAHLKTRKWIPIGKVVLKCKPSLSLLTDIAMMSYYSGLRAYEYPQHDFCFPRREIIRIIAMPCRSRCQPSDVEAFCYDGDSQIIL